jgi:hypothetical protein
MTGLDMAQIFAGVWVSMRTAYAWPRHILPRWTTAPRGKSLPLPLPRSWLGVGTPTPLHSTAHTHSPEGPIMHIKRTLALPLAALTLIAGGLTVGAAVPSPGVGAPTPSASAPFTLPPVLAAHLDCQEDEPCWNCETMGNLRCGGTELDAQDKADAWTLWESAGGAVQLLANPQAKVTLTGYTLTDPYLEGAPDLATQELALDGGDVWYIFTAEAV